MRQGMGKASGETEMRKSGGVKSLSLQVSSCVLERGWSRTGVWELVGTPARTQSAGVKFRCSQRGTAKGRVV